MANGNGVQGSFNKWLGDFPSSQGLSALVILMWAATCGVMLSGHNPAAGWLGALEAVTFASVLHYGVKRFSFKPDGSQDIESDPAAPTPPPVG